MDRKISSEYPGYFKTLRLSDAELSDEKAKIGPLIGNGIAAKGSRNRFNLPRLVYEPELDV
jgi:hypothetical protein